MGLSSFPSFSWVNAFASRHRVRLNRMLNKAGFPRDWFLIPLAAVIGSTAGLAAQGYGQLVRHSEEFFYGSEAGGQLVRNYWWLLPLLPMMGGLLVGLIKSTFKLPMISHGIPEVIEAMARHHGRMKFKTGVFTALNSTITLGSGGATGQEGPIVHIGSVVGSVMGQLLHVSREHMNTLIGCGAAAGLAAIFNAPIAGVLLVLEVVLRDFSLKTFMPLVIASVFGVAVNQALAEDYGALFALPHEQYTYQFTFHEIWPYLVLGIACGLGGWIFARVLVAMERGWANWKMAQPVKPMLGGAAFGLLGLGFVQFYPDVIPGYNPPAFFGNGYAVIEALLTPQTYASHPLSSVGIVTVSFLLLAAVGKTVGTCLILGSGGSGGIFAPTLFIGAAFGGAFGMGLQSTGIYTDISPAAYALAGMAGVLSASVRCPLTAIILVFEITREYKVILPVMLVAIMATVIAQMMIRDSIYTLALRERGIRHGALSDLTLLRQVTVDQVPLSPAVRVYPQDPVQRLIDLAEQYTVADFVVCNEHEKYEGMIAGEDVRTTLLQREAVPLMIVAELMRTDLPTVTRDETLEAVLDKFAHHDVGSLTVVNDDHHVQGLITRSRLIRQYHQVLEAQ